MSQRLEMTAEISGNKKSASAFKSIIKKVSGIVIRIACSGVGGLRDASVNTLRGLASIDTDLIWLLLADVYYYKNKGAISSVELDRTRGDTRSRHQATLEVVIQIQLSVVVVALVYVICEFFEIILVMDEESFDQL
ncbi:hypothetical protein Tco_1167957 [Tanacetum coccineum]